jgi:hypothetical protein
MAPSTCRVSQSTNRPQQRTELKVVTTYCKTFIASHLRNSLPGIPQKKICITLGVRA